MALQPKRHHYTLTRFIAQY